MAVSCRLQVCTLIGTRQEAAGVLKIAKVEIPAKSVVVGHDHLQRSSAGCNGGYVLQYYIFVILQGAALRDAVTFAFVPCPGCGRGFLKDLLCKVA